MSCRFSALQLLTFYPESTIKDFPAVDLAGRQYECFGKDLEAHLKPDDSLIAYRPKSTANPPPPPDIRFINIRFGGTSHRLPAGKRFINLPPDKMSVRISESYSTVNKQPLAGVDIIITNITIYCTHQQYYDQKLYTRRACATVCNGG